MLLVSVDSLVKALTTGWLDLLRKRSSTESHHGWALISASCGWYYERSSLNGWESGTVIPPGESPALYCQCLWAVLERRHVSIVSRRIIIAMYTPCQTYQEEMGHGLSFNIWWSPWNGSLLVSLLGRSQAWKSHRLQYIHRYQKGFPETDGKWAICPSFYLTRTWERDIMR